MRNLILAGRKKVSSTSLEVPDLSLSYSVVDPVDSTIFLIYGPSETLNSIEIQKINVCKKNMYIYIIFHFFYSNNKFRKMATHRHLRLGLYPKMNQQKIPIPYLIPQKYWMHNTLLAQTPWC